MSDVKEDVMLTYEIVGMTCGGCAKSVERAARAAAPDAEIRVDLASRRLEIRGSASPDAVMAAVGAAGYGIQACCG